MIGLNGGMRENDYVKCSTKPVEINFKNVGHFTVDGFYLCTLQSTQNALPVHIGHGPLYSNDWDWFTAQFGCRYQKPEKMEKCLKLF